MSNLRTDYTDAVWTGSKRYTIVPNGDGTSTITDVTAYTNKENSFFGASDANAINGAMNQKADIPINVQVSVLPSQWQGGVSPFYSILTVEGITASTQLNLNLNNDILAKMNESGTVALYCENNNGVAKVYAVGGKPTSTLQLTITLQEVAV